MNKPSNWYYLLPILLSFIGGIIMFFVLRSRDKKMAINGLLLGIVLSIIAYVGNALLFP